MINRRAYWICQAIGWSLYLFANMIFGLTVRPFGWKSALGFILGCSIGFALTHAFRAVVRRYRWADLPLYLLVLYVIPANIIIAFIWLVCGGILTFFVFRVVPVDQFSYGMALVIWFNWSATIFIWSLIYFGVHFFVNYKQSEIRQWQLEATVKEVELRALKAQLNPHFLFNCLNSIRALIIEEPSRAQDAVTKLAGILRYCLQSGEVETSTLRSELQFVEDYIALEAIRYEDRLAVRMDIAPDALDRQMPPMTLQMLVENGIKHGIANSPTGGELAVSARVEGSDLHIRVRNTGRLAASPNSTHLGIKNAAERLKLIFGDAASLTIADSSDNCVTAELVIPPKATNNASINNRR